jgi:two-component system, chemotaxis family, protein-glutamate methylesterase/glutaminase
VNAPGAAGAGAPKKIRVLVVDDAVVVRRMVSTVLDEDPGLEVVGAAANGSIAIQKLTQVNPDIITLDIEMPEMDGLQALKAIRKTHPTLPVIMFSTLTMRGGAATLEALSLGASDYVTKPANVGSVAIAQQRLRDELIPKIKALCARAIARDAPPRVIPPPRPAARFVPYAHEPRVDVVAIGVSTGGPNALAALVPALPAAFPVPVVIVQHMPPMFTRLLAERLNAQAAITVLEAKGGEELRPGVAYLAPGDFHLTALRTGARILTALDQRPAENSCRPSVDVLFRSISAAYGQDTLGVVLTGMGQDGLRGAEDIRRAGGSIVVQDEATSVVWGMPGFIAQAGLADATLPLEQIAGDLIRRCARNRTERWLGATALR